jgi:hypothetical protein
MVFESFRYKTYPTDKLDFCPIYILSVLKKAFENIMFCTSKWSKPGHSTMTALVRISVDALYLLMTWSTLWSIWKLICILLIWAEGYMGEVIYRNNLLGPPSALYLVDDFIPYVYIKRRTLVLLLVMIWIEVIILVRSVPHLSIW